MTREEKINTLKAIIQECEEYQWQRKETLFEIIKDLEQESVLDKIRAEIMSLTNGDTPERIWNVDVLEIIDKYKADKEQEDGVSRSTL